MLTPTVRQFAQADLGIKVLSGPIDGRNRGIFQLDIRRSPAGEYFRLWPGASDTEFSILDVRKDLHQVVLHVREPRRRYEQFIVKTGWMSRERLERETKAEGDRILRESGRHWIVGRWTADHERRYLCGFDEQSLFIAQFREGTTVLEAHHSLMPDEVRRAWERDPEGVRRQGEWFFLPIPVQEGPSLEDYARTHPRSDRSQEALGTGAQPHLADRVLRVERRDRRGNHERRRLEVYVQGRVRHSDHREIRFDHWHRVVRNAALPLAGADRERVRWID